MNPMLRVQRVPMGLIPSGRNAGIGCISWITCWITARRGIWRAGMIPPRKEFHHDLSPQNGACY